MTRLAARTRRRSLRQAFRYPFIAVTLISLPIATSAHHSRAEFSDDVTQLTGELVRVQWRNPHAGLDILVRDAQGNEEQWRIETFGSPNTMARWSVEREHFTVGEQITVAGSVSTRRARYMLGTNVLLESGLEVILGAMMTPVWSGDHIGGRDFSDRDLSNTAAVAGENRGLFRNWSLPGWTTGLHQHFPFTEEAKAAMAIWDPVTAPVNQCEAPGMPFPMLTPLSIELIDNGDTITVNAEFFGTQRTVHLNAADPATVAPSPLGFSMGHWEGTTLVVETTRIDYPYFNSSGAPQSNDVRTIERFELSDDQETMTFRMTVYDDVTFSEPATYRRAYVALGEPYVPLDCTIF
jgi:hypothetical protein